MRRLFAAALATLLAVGQAHAQSSYFNGRNYGSQTGRPILLPYTTVQSDGGNDTAGVQAAINVSQGQPFILAAAVFHVCGLTINNSQALLGSGVGVTTLEPVTGCTAPLVSSYQFGSLTGSGSSGGPADFEIGNFSIVGPSATGTTGSGVAVYGRQFRVHDLYVTGMGGSGLWTEYTRSGNGTSPYDCHVYRVTIDTVGQTGWYNGCSDVHADDINVRGASQVSTGTYDGIEADTNAAIHGSNINVWGASFSDPVHRYSLNLAGDASTIANVHLETGRSADLFVGGNLNNVTGLYAYNLPNAGTPVAIIVQGNQNTIQGVAAPNTGNAAAVGVQLGTAANRATSNSLFLIVDGFTNGLYDFTYDGGYNLIAGSDALTSGTSVIGAASLDDAVFQMGSGASAYTRFAITEASGLISDGFTALGLKGQHNVTFRGAVSDQSYDDNTTAVTTGSDTVPAIVSTYLIDTALLASFTLTMPATPLDGLLLTIAASGGVTTFTLSPNAGQTIQNAPTSLTAGVGVQFQWIAASTKWIRRQ